MKAVVLAGGRGTRLAPYTSVLPKPLMPIGDQAILEIVVDQLAEAGFVDITFCVGYLSHLIEALFNDGGGRGAHIRYLREKEPLGTAGPLRSLPDIDDAFLAMNGDVLTTLDYHDLVQKHRSSGSLLTIATHRRAMRIDYGVLQLESDVEQLTKIEAYDEKPELPLVVSMGVYVLEPEAIEFIPEGIHYDIPDLVQDLLKAGQPVSAYQFDGYWLDIGRHEDYEEATTAWAQHRATGRVRTPAE